jgi:hypothetical protein
MKQRIEPGGYYAIVARAARLPLAEVYRWTVREPLPPLPIPLREPDPDPLIDLVDRCRVSLEPDPPLARQPKYRRLS